jgi:hypothetical protein
VSEIPGFAAAERRYENLTDDPDHPDDCPFCTQDNEDPEAWDE